MVINSNLIFQIRVLGLQKINGYAPPESTATEGLEFEIGQLTVNH